MSKVKLASDPRFIYVLLILVIALPIIAQAVVPVPVTETTRAVYEFVENLLPNSLVVVSFDYSTSTVPELQPQATIVTQHLFLKQLRLLFVAQWTDGPALTDAVLEAIDKGDKIYGTGYATLGYIPNTATLIGMTADIQSFFPVDTRGNPTQNLPIIKEFPAARQAALVITFVAGEPGLSAYLQYWQSRLNIPVAAGAVAALAPGFMPFYNSQQLVGLLISIRAAAEYELLEHSQYPQVPIGLSGATSAMVAQSTSHLLIVAMVIVGNAAYFVNRRKKGGSR